MELILSSAKQSLMITFFVLSMMLIIEYMNVLTRGLWSKDLGKSIWKQIFLGALLGIIPGCLGAYTAVSLFVHNYLGLGALVATMIATSGDEAFLMFSIIPETALLLHVIIFIIAIAAGFLTHLLFKNRKTAVSEKAHFHLHNVPECVCFDKTTILHQLRHLKPKRLFFMVFILFMMLFVLFGFGHNHETTGSILDISNHPHNSHSQWIKITFIVVLAFAFFTVLAVNDHFLDKHLWDHIIKKHFLKIFLWSFGTLLVFNYLDNYLNLSELINENLWVVLIVAVLVGIVPESGPHFIFVILFAGGTLPFSILLANSIVQDGHGSLPLLAESQKDFVFVKIINIAVGFMVGALGLLSGF